MRDNDDSTPATSRRPACAARNRNTFPAASTQAGQEDQRHVLSSWEPALSRHRGDEREQRERRDARGNQRPEDAASARAADEDDEATEADASRGRQAKLAKPKNGVFTRRNESDADQRQRESRQPQPAGHPLQQAAGDDGTAALSTPDTGAARPIRPTDNAR
jgi:hypothetical protein